MPCAQSRCEVLAFCSWPCHEISHPIVRKLPRTKASLTGLRHLALNDYSFSAFATQSLLLCLLSGLLLLECILTTYLADR